MQILEIGKMINRDVFNAFATIYNKNRVERFQIDSLSEFVEKAESQHDPIKMNEMIQVIWNERKKGKTQKEISKIVGLSVSAVQYHLKNLRNKILPRNESKTRFRGEKLERLKDFMVELKRDGKTNVEIAEIVKISDMSVSRHLKNREINREAENVRVGKNF